MPDLPVTLAALLTALHDLRFDGEILVRFRNGEPIGAREINTTPITFVSPANGRPTPPEPPVLRPAR